MTGAGLLTPAMAEELGKAQAAGESFFMGKPDRWWDAHRWRCTNGHVSNYYIKSEGLGFSACPVCMAGIVLTFPEDR